MPRFTDMIESKYLTKDDVNPECIVTIKNVIQEEVQGDNNQSQLVWILYVNEFSKGVRLNTGHKTTLDEILNGATSEQSIGKQIILWNNPSVEYKGKVTGGIRIRSYNPVAAAHNPQHRNGSY